MPTFRPVSKDKTIFYVEKGQFMPPCVELTRAELQAALTEMDNIEAPFRFFDRLFPKEGGLYLEIEARHSQWAMPMTDTRTYIYMSFARARQFRDYLNLLDLGDK